MNVSIQRVRMLVETGETMHIFYGNHVGSTFSEYNVW